MSTAEVKNYLHKLIVEMEDSKLLEDLANYANSLLAKEHNWWDDLTEEQKIKMHQALSEAKNGETFSRDEMKKEINEMLKNKK